MHLCSLQNALRDVTRVWVRVGVKVLVRVSVGLRFRSEICKLCDFKIVQHILQIV